MAARTCFVINLDRSPERLRVIAERLDSAGIAFERFAAIDGRTLDIDDKRIFNRRAYEFMHGKAPTTNEVACCLSHVGALTAFLATDAARCLILEDDAIVPPDLEAILSRLDAVAEDWDMVFLYGNHEIITFHLRQLDASHDLVGYFARQTGAVAYLVNRRAAKVLSEHALPMRLPYDRDFDRAWTYGIRIRGVMPLPVTTGAHESDIGTIGGKFPFHRRLGTFLTRGLTETRRTIHYLFVDPIWFGGLLHWLRPRKIADMRRPSE